MAHNEELASVLPPSLVFLKPAGSKMEPYTTHEIIADCAGVKRKTVSRLIKPTKQTLNHLEFWDLKSLN